MRPMRRWHVAGAAAAMAAIAVGSLATGAAAADPMSVTFQATYSGCVHGTSNRDLAALTLLDHDTVVDNALPFTVHGNGKFEACFPTGIVDSGLTLVAFDPTAHTDSFTIPPLSVRVDRVTDVVKGRSRANHALTIRVYDCDFVAGKVCPKVATRTVSTDSAGLYRTDLTHAFNIRGLDSLTATYANSHGDTWKIFQTAPYFRSFVGTSLVIGDVNPHQAATFRLWNHPGGSVLSTRHITGESFAGHFDLNFGTNLQDGRRVTADFASDAKVTLPNTAITFPIESGDQKIRVHCLPNRRVIIMWQSTHTGVARRTADSQGRASVNLSSAETEGFRLPPASQVSSGCQTAAGDTVEAFRYLP
jgi:hypothetical protein